LPLIDLDLPDSKVYRADAKLNLTPVAFERRGRVPTFPVQVEGDWAEFLIR